MSCRLPCDVELPRGRYLIRVEQTPTTFDGEREVTIDAPSRVTLSLSSRSTRSTGLTFGIVGVASLAIGSTLIGTSIRPDGFRNDIVSGVTLAVAGVVFGPIGFIMYGSSFHTGIEVEPRWNAAAPRAGIGFVVLPGGSGVGGSFVF